MEGGEDALMTDISELTRRRDSDDQRSTRMLFNMMIHSADQETNARLKATRHQCTMHEPRLPMRGIYCPHSAPPLPLASCWRFHLHFALLHLVPVRAQCRSTTLLVTLHHRPLCVFVGVGKDLLEERVECGITTDVRVFIGRLFFLGSENAFSDALPVLATRGRTRGRRFGGVGGGVGESFKGRKREREIRTSVL